ncbi:helix-turn-helix domain-containing protein [Coriobacteriia bacterium Es71-Z0120]|uniref:helix-turn-helix domain-containing protein n=1 Tax=Parvivirga hydrogeniphila TaxID=2939460 RepID=UPI002260A4B2|nr:helix-turn-helix transcriptional regulator [Parvivirga hydrogeniphila]MCL4078646.1 helix-turn-helix domain-containing protein [Parvivirga hydrogeniphila]
MATTVGHTLRSLRVSRNETLLDVSRATGLSVAMISRIERGERAASPAAILALAKHYGLPPDELVGEAIAERMCARYGSETASWAAVLLVQTSRASSGRDVAPARRPAPTDAAERAVFDLVRAAEWGSRDQALAACNALRRFADVSLRALRDVRERHPDPAVRSAAAALLKRDIER